MDESQRAMVAGSKGRGGMDEGHRGVVAGSKRSGGGMDEGQRGVVAVWMRVKEEWWQAWMREWLRTVRTPGRLNAMDHTE